MKVMKRILCIIMIAALAMSVVAMSTISTAASGSGVGLAEWAFRAYNEGWSYVWGGDSVGAVDCSGMITSYCGGNRTSMLADAKEHGRDWGYVSDGIPNIHGLGLSRPNHVGVYVGNGMEIDARGDAYDVCYEAVGDRWECWFKLTAVTYPTTGWQKFNGSYYYYENGEYLANTSRTINGNTYYFSSSGVSSEDPTTVKAKPAPVETKTVVDDGPLKKGSRGERVEKLQARLLELGYYGGVVDGDFGPKTEQAFKLFQAQAGLYVDGIAGSDADYLYSDDAPAYVPLVVTSTRIKSTATTTGLNLGTSLNNGNESDDTNDNNDNNNNNKNNNDDSNGQDPIENEQVYAAAEDKPEEQPAVSFANGDSGETVESIQNRLIKLGYLDGSADGAFGAMTETAVRKFQTANKLADSGVVDQATYDTLFSSAAVKNALVSAESEAAVVIPAATVAANTAMDSSVERENAALSQQSGAAITDTVGSRKASNANLEFIVWLAIMIVVMLIAFAVVYKMEKKRSFTMTYMGRRFQ